MDPAKIMTPPPKRRPGLLILAGVLAIVAVGSALNAVGAAATNTEVAISLGVSVLLALGALWAFIAARP